MESTDALCPVCAEPCNNLPHHLEGHSKEEIIQSLSSNRSCSNVSDRNLCQNVESSDNKVASIDNSSFIGGSNTSSEPSFAGSSSFSSSSLYCGTNLPNRRPLLPKVKNITNGYNVLSSSTQVASSSFLQNGSCLSQITPQGYTVMYQQPNNIYQNIDGNNSVNAPGLIQNYNQSSILNSQTIRPSHVNQQVAQTEVIMAQANSRVVNNLESRPSHIKINSDVSSVAVNSFPGTSFLSNNVAVPSNNGSQHVFCLLPYSQVQPSLPASGNFVMYNNLLQGNSTATDVLQQQCGVNYFVGGSNPNMSLNNSNVPNQIYYLPSNVGTVGARQDGLHPPLQSQNVIVNKNASQLAAPHISLSATGPPTQAPLATTVANKSILRTVNDDVENISADKTTETENVTTLRIGDSIKISLPKDIAEKKDRLKELINRELCRAILLNDSGELGSKCIEFGENTESQKSVWSKETKTNSLLKLPDNTDVRSCNNDIDVSIKSTSGVDFQENNISLDSPLPDSSPLYTLDSPFKLLQGSLSADTKDVKNNFKFRDSSFNSLFPKIFADNISNDKNSVKLEDQLSIPGVSGIKQNVSVNSSTSLILPTRNLNFLDFSDMGYGGEHELGAVEEVLAGENMIPTSLDCKPCEPQPSSAKLMSSFSSDNPNDNSENSYSSSNIDNEMETSLKDSFLFPKNVDRYAKTYFRARKVVKSVGDKGSSIPSVGKKSSYDEKPKVIMDPTQINLKIQHLSEQIDEEMIDDPLYDDGENSSITNEIFMNDLPKSQVLENEQLSDESKGYLSVYQGIPMKMETGESNGTLAEEVLSLKASETLADSDSERATPNEEVTEMYYGKSCIFAGEPGPANLSSQRYTPIEPLELSSHSQHEEQSSENDSLQESQSLATQVTVDLSVNAVRTHGETPEDDTISLILDANCSIVPADTVQHLPHLLDHDQSSNLRIFHGNFLKRENCSEELTKQQFAHFPEDSKAFVTTGLVDKCLVPVSPHASTSGLQNVDKNIVKKAGIEDEDYDFEYESDGYGDSDFSDSAHQQKSGSLDLEKWRCNRCNKTFKSLKEKLLHSGHHSPCSLGGKGSSPDEGELVAENSWECQNDMKNSKSGILKEENIDSKLSSSEKTQKLLIKKNNLIKGKKRMVLNKIKPEEGNSDVHLESTSVDSTAVIGTEGEFNCTECSLTFPTLDKLYEHRKTALKSRYMCPVCHIEFQNRIEKLRHIKTHPTSDFMCSICHRSFDNFYLWSKHQLFHMGLIFFECKECGYKCQRRGELKIHYRKHSGEKPYSCETCLRSFVSNQSLKRHLLVHMVGQEVECEICFKRYKNGLVLNKHKLKAHSKKKMFVKKRTDFICDICNEIFHSEKKLTWHQETHKRWPKKCQTCGECFIHQANLTKHIRRKHDANYMPPGTDKESTVCLVCKKVYKRSSLPLHMRIHNGVKPYKCNVCNKEFTVKCNFDSHKWTHTGTRDRPYKCKLCDRSYHLHGLLDMHIRSHKKIRPYTCNECGKSFIRKNNYQTHKALHTGEKQHECKFCGKTFFRKYNLNNHVRIHTGETPYECTICRKEFAQKSNYNVHMKAFHVERHAIHEEV